MPRLQDLMQTYLREMRPEELRGSAGTYRLREELMVPGHVAVAPATVKGVLFTQTLDTMSDTPIRSNPTKILPPPGARTSGRDGETARPSQRGY